MPKLTDSCLLVTVNISSFSGTKTDKRLTTEVTNTHKTKGDALRVVKRLISDDATKAFKKIESEARSFHRANTVPWQDDGSRMLPTRHHLTYMESMRALRVKFEDEAHKFCEKWPETIAQAKVDLNGTFNESDYPSVHTIAQHFRFRISCAPVPDVGDIRVDLPAQEVQSIRDELNGRIREAEGNARNELLTRLAEPLAAMVNKLSTKDAVFRDSLVTNVMDIANLIPSLNVTGDSQLETIRGKILAELGTYRADDLRDDVFARKEAAERAQAILKMMDPEFQEAA